MMHGVHRVTSLLLAVVLVGSLAGCIDDPDTVPSALTATSLRDGDVDAPVLGV